MRQAGSMAGDKRSLQHLRPPVPTDQTRWPAGKFPPPHVELLLDPPALDRRNFRASPAAHWLRSAPISLVTFVFRLKMRFLSPRSGFVFKTKPLRARDSQACARRSAAMPRILIR